MKKRKIIHVLLACFLVFSLFIAGNTSVQAGGGSQSASGAAATPVVNVEVFNRGTDGGRSDPTQNNYTDWIKEKILKEENIAITFISVPRSDEVPALNI